MNALAPLPGDDLEDVFRQVGDAWEKLRGRNIFISGASGFFGSWLLETLLFAADRLDLGAKVWALTRDVDRFRFRLPHLAGHPAVELVGGGVESFRDWGRDCWCPSGKDNTCGKRFGWKLGELPEGYDHKYIYSHLGYNLKPLDLQAAIGRAQLKKLPSFIQARRQNWEILRSGLEDLAEFFDFMLPTHATGWLKGGKVEKLEGVLSTPQPLDSSTFCWDSSGCSSSPSWFGFMLRMKENKNLTSRNLAAHLDQQAVGNRMLFGGNLTKQPVFSW